MITVKCTSCTEKLGKGNVLYELKPLEFPVQLNGKFIIGKCPSCGNEIFIGVDN